LPALISLSGKEKRSLVWNMAKNGAGRTTWCLFPQQVIENRGGDGFLGAGLAKNKLWTDMLGLLSPKTTLNLCYGLIKVSCSNGFAPGDVVRGRRLCFVGDWKIQFTGVFPLFNATDASLDCKNDLVSSQNAFSTKGTIITWFFKS
jgi:hypothetical protein